MADSPRRLYEFALAAAIVAVLLALLLPTLEQTRREVEEAAMQSEVTALRVELLDRLSHREGQGGPLPAGANPVDWAGRAPGRYLGVLDEAPMERGVWYFDRPSQLLIYRYRQEGEAAFRLVRQASPANVPGILGGVGLQRLPENVPREKNVIRNEK